MIMMVIVIIILIIISHFLFCSGSTFWQELQLLMLFVVNVYFLTRVLWHECQEDVTVIIIKAICYTKPMKPKLLLGNSKIGCCRFNLWGSLHYLGWSFVPGCYKMRKTPHYSIQ